MTKGILAGVMLTSVAALSGCSLPPMISDTGYRGTWRRGNERQCSIVAITQVGDRWFFRWTLRDRDGSRTVQCGWDGHCEERQKGELVATYTITTRMDPVSGTLATDTIEERLSPEKKTFRYSDAMEVADQGRTLLNYTTDRDGDHFEGAGRPRRLFSKVSDSIADPPRAEHP